MLHGIRRWCSTARRLRAWLVPALAIWLTAGAPLAQAAGGPVRVEVLPERLEVLEEQEVEVTIRLAGRDGGPAAAPKPMDIQFVIAGTGAERTTVPVRFDQGDRTRRIRVPARGSGVLSLEANHRELLKGEALLRVRSSLPMAARSGDVTAAEIPRERPGSEANRLPEAAERPAEAPPVAAGEEPLAGIEGGEGPEPEPEEDAAGGAAAAGGQVNPPLPRPSIKLQGVPDRPLDADGEDEARIYALLQGGTNPTDIEVQLLGSRGFPNPIDLTIPRHETIGVAGLTTEDPGSLTVEFVRSNPAVELAGPGRLEFDVHPPVDGLEVAERLAFGVGDEVRLAANLVNGEGIPVQTMKPRTVHFDVLSGKVRVAEDRVRIAEGESGAKTSLSAHWWGDATIKVWTPDLAERHVEVSVRWQWALLGVTALGGLLGGLLAWFHGPMQWRRLAVRALTGLVAGLVLYWLLLYLAFVPEVAVNNPIGAFCVTVIGGWLGTEVFDIGARLLKALLTSARTAR